MIHRVQHDLWNLRASGIIEKNEPWRATQRGERSANGFNRENCIRRCRNIRVKDAFGRGLQALLLVTSEKLAPNSMRNGQRQTYTRRKRSSRARYTALRIEYVRSVCREKRERYLIGGRGARVGCEATPSRESKNMPVSSNNSKLIYDALKECDIRLVSALPETWLVHLIRMADDDPEMILVRLAKEEEGVGVSAGAHFAGVKSAMLMQNHGFLASINGIVSFAHLYKIPLLMLISYRGTFGERDPWQTQGGNVTEPVLRALGIPHFFLDGIETVKKRIRQAQTLAESSLQPVALLLTRDLMWEE